MRPNLQHAIFAFSAIALTVAGAWYFREPLGRHLGRVIVEHSAPALLKGELSSVASSGRQPAPVAERQTVYRWVDADGVTHFDEHGGAGREAVAVDPGKIQRLQDFTPPDPAQSQP